MTTNSVSLRAVAPGDLPVFFENQLDAEANRLVGFKPRDREAFDAHWAKILADPSLDKMTVVFDGAVAGNVVAFDRDGARELGYWLGRAYWGKGIGGRAVALFLKAVKTRPLLARVSSANPGSIKVLEKNNFKKIGDERYTTAGGEVLPGFVYELRS